MYMTATDWPQLEDPLSEDDPPGEPCPDLTRPPTEFRSLSNCEFLPFDEHL